MWSLWYKPSIWLSFYKDASESTQNCVYVRDTRIAYSVGMLKEIKYCWISGVFWKKVYCLVCALCWVLSSFSIKLWCLKCTKILVIGGILSNISKALTYRIQVFKVFHVNSQNQFSKDCIFQECVYVCVCTCLYAFSRELTTVYAIVCAYVFETESVSELGAHPYITLAGLPLSISTVLWL